MKTVEHPIGDDGSSTRRLDLPGHRSSNPRSSGPPRIALVRTGASSNVELRVHAPTPLVRTHSEFERFDHVGRQTLSFPNRLPLVAKRVAIFVKPRRGSRKPVEVQGVPKYKIVPVKRENDQWITEDGQQLPLSHWKEESVAEVDPSSKSTILIYVNMSNPDFIQAIHRRSVGEDTIRRYSDRYKVAIAFHTYIQDHSVREMAAQRKTIPQDALDGELQRIVRTVIYTTFVAPEQDVFVGARSLAPPG